MEHVFQPPEQTDGDTEAQRRGRFTQGHTWVGIQLGLPASSVLCSYQVFSENSSSREKGSDACLEAGSLLHHLQLQKSLCEFSRPVGRVKTPSLLTDVYELCHHHPGCVTHDESWRSEHLGTKSSASHPPPSCCPCVLSPHPYSDPPHSPSTLLDPCPASSLPATSSCPT